MFSLTGVVVSKAKVICPIPSTTSGKHSLRLELQWTGKPTVRTKTNISLILYEVENLQVVLSYPTTALIKSSELSSTVFILFYGSGFISGGEEVCYVDSLKYLANVVNQTTAKCEVPRSTKSELLSLGFSLNGYDRISSTGELKIIFEAAAPKMVRSLFTNTGAQIMVLFDNPVEVPQDNLQNCEEIFDDKSLNLLGSTLNTKPACIWVSEVEIIITPTNSATLEPGQKITLRKNSPNPITSKDHVFSRKASGSIVVDKPVRPVIPIPALSGKKIFFSLIHRFVT